MLRLVEKVEEGFLLKIKIKGKERERERNFSDGVFEHKFIYVDEIKN